MKETMSRIDNRDYETWTNIRVDAEFYLFKILLYKFFFASLYHDAHHCVYILTISV